MTRFGTSLFFLFSFSVAAHSAPVGDRNSCPQVQRPVAVVLSGGTSLGAYQAGAMARLLESLKSESKRFDLKLLAGASAGGINSLLAFQDYCAKRKASAGTGWLQTFWTTPVANELFSPQEERSSLLRNQAFDSVNAAFFNAWKTSEHQCDLVLAIPLTYKNPEKWDVSGGQTSNAQFLNFALRARPGAPSLITNHVNIFESSNSPLLDLESSDTTDVLARLARATSSIPIIFPAEKISFCNINKDDPRVRHLHPPFRCPEDLRTTGEFIDGALLDTTPMAMAVRLLKRGLVHGCQSGHSSNQWLTIPSQSASEKLNPEILIINLDVRNRQPTGKKSQSLASGVSQLVGDLLQSARDRELISILENEDNVRRQILSLRSFFPRWSEEWNGFFGFFDKDLRAFDYAVGYVDMEETLRQDLPSLLGESPQTGSPLIECLRSVARDTKTIARASTVPVCDGLERDQKTLFEILSSERHGQKEEQQSSSRFFKRMDQLSKSRYEFDELGLGPDESAMAPVRVRSWIGQSARQLTHAFPDDSSTTLNAVSNFLFGVSDPLPEERNWHLGWGSSFEAGFSQLVGLDYENARFWRWPVVLEVYSPRGLTTSQEEGVSASFMTGLELQKASSSSLDYILGLRVGYQITNRDEDGVYCQQGQLESCEGLSFSPMIAAVFFGSLRLQTGIKMTWDHRDPKNVNSTGLFQGGFQF